MRCLRTCCLVFAVAICVAQAEGLPQERYHEQRQFADGLYSRGMYELAVREYTALLAAAPDGPENDVVEFRLGESLRFLGKLKEAGERFSHLFATYPESDYRLRSAYRRARLYMETGKYGAAAAHFSAILQQDGLERSLAAACRFYLGDCLAELERNDEAAAALADMVAKEPDSVFVPYALMREAEVLRRGLVGLSGADLAKATDRILPLYARVLEKPGEGRLAAEALFQTAEIYFRRKDYQRSAEFYRRLLKDYATDQRAAEARLQAAWSATHAGLHAQALAIAEQALSEDPCPQRVEWLYLAANCQRLLARPEEAVASYKQLISLEPHGRFADPARYEMALSLLKQGHHAEAVATAEQIPLTSPLRLDVAWLLAECQAALGAPGKAIQYYRIVEKEAPDGDMARDATYRLAYTLQQQEAWQEASRYYTRLVERFPKSSVAPQALFASGLCLQRAGDLAGAARDWTRVSHEFSSSPLAEEATYQAAMAHMRLDENDAAAALLDELLRRYGKGGFAADAHYWRGMIYKRAGELAPAANQLRLAINAEKPEIAQLATYNLALICRKQDKSDEAAQLLRRILGTPVAETFPPALNEWLSEHYYAKRQYKDAAQSARQLVDGQRELPWLQAGWCLLGRAEAAGGNKKKAREAFAEALRVPAPTAYGAEAALRLGQLELDAGAHAEARSHFEMAIARAASEKTLAIRARAYFGVAQAAAASGDQETAARNFMMVAILFDDPAIVPDALHGAAVAFLALGDQTQAREAVEELAERYPDSSWAAKAQALMPEPSVTEAAAGSATAGKDPLPEEGVTP